MYLSCFFRRALPGLLVCLLIPLAEAGMVVRFIFDGAQGPPSSLKSDPRFVNMAPTRKEVSTQGLSFYGANAPGEQDGVLYNSFIRGYIVAPESGDFVFFIRSDDASEMFLSSDTSETPLQKICSEPLC